MISIERAFPEQAVELSKIALEAKSHWGYPRHWMEMWRPQLTFGPEYFEEYESWVAVKDGRPIGFYTLEEKNGNAWLENLWILPEYMGRGVGKMLFLHARDLSRQRGYRLLQLEADPNAAGFYKKMGMYKIKERHYDIDGRPRILPTMELKL
jgi:ribosomal protein S18 acetylase RimI-like enzyme